MTALREPFDEAGNMCPNCVTPWKCNGPHLYEETPYGRREPQTEAGRRLLAFWLGGRTHPPSTVRLRDFTDHILDIEAEAAETRR